MKYIILFVTILFTSVLFTNETSAKKVFVGLVIKNNNAMLPYFLKSISNLDYNKEKMVLELALYNKTPQAAHLVETWLQDVGESYSKATSYRSLSNDSRLDPLSSDSQPIARHTIAEIKNKFLERCASEGCDLCFILESDIFLHPSTLRILAEKNTPIIAPLLRPLPSTRNVFRNFFVAATESGYYKEHPDYWPIMERTRLGTFKVDCVSGAHLIQAQYLDQIGFWDEYKDYDSLALSRKAKSNNIDLFICNEREFGRFVLREFSSLKEEQEFSTPEMNIEVTPTLLNTLFSKYYVEDPSLKHYIQHFPLDSYALYSGENGDVYYLDEPYDFIKSRYLKNGQIWEKDIRELLKAHARPGSVAVDIGGHIGTHTLALSRFVGPEGTVHVFEPQDKLFPELVINMHINGRNNIVFHHQAIGNESKFITLKHFSGNEGMTRIGPGGETVQMISLDSLQLSDVSVMKIDVEGAEDRVIEGARETIQSCKPTIIIEIIPGPNREATIKNLQNMGYTVTCISKDHDFLCLPNV